MLTVEGKEFLKINVHYKLCYSLSLGISYDVISSWGIPDGMAVPNTFLKYLLERKKKMRYNFEHFFVYEKFGCSNNSINWKKIPLLLMF